MFLCGFDAFWLFVNDWFWWVIVLIVLLVLIVLFGDLVVAFVNFGSCVVWMCFVGICAVFCGFGLVIVFVIYELWFGSFSWVLRLFAPVVCVFLTGDLFVGVVCVLLDCLVVALILFWCLVYDFGFVVLADVQFV